MGSFTRVYMSATFPECSTLGSIGSVAANFASTSQDDESAEFLRYSHGSDIAELIRGTYGNATYDAYLKEMQQNNEADATQLAKQQARRRARRAAVTKVFRRLIAFVTKVRENR